jgi:hypothetical protein
MKKLIFLLIIGLLFIPLNVGAVSLDFAWTVPVGGTTPTGYKVYYGQTHRSYSSSVDVGNVLTYTISLDVTAGGTWFFSTTAYTASLESGFSNEISKTYAVGGVEVGGGGGWFWIP